MTGPGSAARVAVVDDHELLAQSVCYALAARGLAARPVPLSDPATVLAGLLAEPPHLVLLDLDLGGAMGSGTGLVRPLTEAGVRVLVVSGTTEEVDVAEALEAGAVGYVPKSAPFDELLATAERAVAGHQVLGDLDRLELLAALRRHRRETQAALEPFARLTPREEQVLHALCEGDSVTTIATRWYVSLPTVRTQVRAILLKLGVGSQLEAVALAHRAGWHDAGRPSPSA